MVNGYSVGIVLGYSSQSAGGGHPVSILGNEVASRHSRSCSHCSIGSPAAYRIGSDNVVSFNSRPMVV